MADDAVPRDPTDTRAPRGRRNAGASGATLVPGPAAPIGLVALGETRA